MVLIAEGARVAGGAATSGAPSPSAGIGARPVSIAALEPGLGTAPGCAAGAASATAGAGAITRASEFPLRLPNTGLVSGQISARPFHQFGEQRSQQAAAGPFRLGAPGQHL